MQLEGSRVLLTGASGGLGRAMAVALHARGAHLLLSGRRGDALRALASELGDRAEPLVADLEGRDAPAALAASAGAVDVLVANAALPASGALTAFEPDQIDRALDVNLRAPIQLARALAPGMVERGHGQIVFISSFSGKVAAVGSSIYSATKFGLRGFAGGLREDLVGSGVGVTTVFPSFVEGAGMLADSGAQLPRWVGMRTPEQVAQAVVRGIEHDRAEVDVAPLSLRAGAFASSLAPVTVARVQRRLGASRIADAIAHGQRSKR